MLLQKSIHPAPLLCPFYAFFPLTPLANLHDFLIVPFSFWFNALWLAAFHYAKPLRLKQISYLKCPFFMPSSSRKNRTLKKGCLYKIHGKETSYLSRLYKKNNLVFNFDMCCSVHFCDNNFYNQQMHTLHFVGHFIGLPTCFDPYGSLSGHLIH
jgi:hypothetical protein